MPFPDTLAGYQFGIDAASTFTDAGTTPCASNGDLIQQATDLSGNDRHATQATSGSRPDYVVVAGKPVMRFSDKVLETPSFLDSSFDTSTTLYVVWEFHGGASLSIAAAANGTNLFLGQETNALQPRVDCYTSGQGDRYVNFDSANRMVVAIRFNGSTKTMRVVGDGGVDETASSAMTASLGLSGALTIGRYGGGGFVWQGFICAVHLYNAAHSDADFAAMISHLAGLYLGEPSPTSGTTGAGDINVLCDGNSLTAGSGAETAGYPAQLETLLGAGWSVSQIGVGGQMTGSMLMDADTQADALYDASASQNILIAWEGTNDLYNGLSPGQSARRMRDYVLRRRHAGWQKVYTMAVLSRSDPSTPATFNTSRATYNSTLATTHGGTAVVRLDQDSRIGDDGDEQNSPPFAEDLVHMLDEGYGYVAEDVYAILTAAASSSRNRNRLSLGLGIGL